MFKTPFQEELEKKLKALGFEFSKPTYGINKIGYLPDLEKKKPVVGAYRKQIAVSEGIRVEYVLTAEVKKTEVADNESPEKLEELIARESEKTEDFEDLVISVANQKGGKVPRYRPVFELSANSRKAVYFDDSELPYVPDKIVQLVKKKIKENR